MADLGHGREHTAASTILGQRSARFLKLFGERSVGLAMELRLQSPADENKLPEGIENPFVITTLVAGLAGVTLSIIIILSIWILQKPTKNDARRNRELGSGVRGQDSSAVKEGTTISHITVPLPVNAHPSLSTQNSPMANQNGLQGMSMLNPAFKPHPPPEHFPHKHVTLLIKVPMETSV